MRQARVAQQGAQSLIRDDALAQASMHIAMAAQCFLGVVKMNDMQTLQPYTAVNLIQDVLRGSSSCNVVSRAPQMGSVDAHTQTLAILRREIENGAELFKAVSKRVTRAYIIL